MSVYLSEAHVLLSESLVQADEVFCLQHPFLPDEGEEHQVLPIKPRDQQNHLAARDGGRRGEESGALERHCGSELDVAARTRHKGQKRILNKCNKRHSSNALN